MLCFSEQINMMMMMKVKLIFWGAWNSLMAWPDWPRPFFYFTTDLRHCQLMTNVKEFHFTWEWIFSRMKRIESVLHSSMEQERITTWPFWTLGKTLSTKWTLQTLLIYSQLQKPGKDGFKCFVLRTCNFGFRSNLFLYQKFFCCQCNMKKYSFLNFCDFCIFKSHKDKVSNRTGAP